MISYFAKPTYLPSLINLIFSETYLPTIWMIPFLDARRPLILIPLSIVVNKHYYANFRPSLNPLPVRYG